MKSLYSNMTKMALCLCLSLLGSGCVTTNLHSTAYLSSPMVNAKNYKTADVAKEMAEWVVSSGDNHNKPFAIIDKVKARVYVYSVYGKLHGDAPVLLGLSKGDYAPPGLGNKPLSKIPPSQRITPAGRFVAIMGHNHKGKEILWVDYDQSLSLHPVVKGTKRDRRAERLASPTPRDNRISFGCINVPKKFFKDVVHNTFDGTAGIVYILPETEKFRKASRNKSSKIKLSGSPKIKPKDAAPSTL